MMETPRPKVGHLIGLIFLCLAVAGIAGAITVPEVAGWYQILVHPFIAPPDYVFGPVWTVLYILMALAAWRAWGRDAYLWQSTAIQLFLFQLALNFAWSFIFFRYHQMGAAFVEILLLELAILVTLRAFLKRDLMAGILMIPYAAWVGFASWLNFEFWRLN